MRLTPAARENTAWLLAGAALGALVFFIRFGMSTADPFNDSWIGAGRDLSTHYVGWRYYAMESWGWPLTHIRSLCAPLGTTVGMTDSIPLAAVLGKAIVMLIGRDFQYFGIWLLLNHILQGFFAARLCVRLSASSIARAAMLGIILLAPPFLYRVAHISLSSHWLLLWAIYVYLYSGPSLLRTLPPLLVAAFVHPYLTAMVLAITTAKLLRSSTHFTAFLRRFAITMALVLIAFYLGGTLDPTRGASDNAEFGFGRYSANLAFPINGDGFSQFGLTVQRKVGQHEGFGYFGLGLLTLVVALSADRRSRSALREMLMRHRPLAGILLALLILAVSNKLTFGTQTVALIQIPGIDDSPLATFRASGRFLWPAWYLFALALVVLIDKGMPHKRASYLLSAVLLLQVVDLIPLWSRDPGILLDKNPDPAAEQWAAFSDAVDSAPVIEQWKQIMAEADTLIAYPPFGTSPPPESCALVLSQIALANRIPVTTGYVARPPIELGRAYQMQIRHRLMSDAMPRPQERVVIAAKELPEFLPALKDRYFLYRIGADWIASGSKIESMEEADPGSLDSAGP